MIGSQINAYYTISGNTYYFPKVKEGTLTLSKDGAYSLSYRIIYTKIISQYSDTLNWSENGIYQLSQPEIK